jgi:hypothetical protein
MKAVEIVPSGVTVTCSLILLCQKIVRRVMRWQHGQRGRMRLMVRVIAMRTDVIEFGT